MSAEIARISRTQPATASLAARLYGFGSPFGKALRDSRLSTGAVGGTVAVIVLLGGQAMARSYGTLEAREQMADYATHIPAALRGMYGEPVNVGTLGGFVSWHYAAIFTLLVGLWSILALSSTLALEAKRQSLEFVVASPIGRRRIALEKLAAHVVALAVAMGIVALAAWLSGTVLGTLPGDAIPPEAAVGYALWLGLLALAAGSVAFALAPFVGNRSAAGLAGVVLFGGFVVNGYQASIPPFESIAGLTWFSWTAHHVPLAGQYDWPSLVPVAILTVVMCALGVEAFARRDVGASTPIRAPRLPTAMLGLRGPLGRSWGELLNSALAWGVGLGAYGLIVAGASRSFAEEIVKAPDILKLAREVLPGVDVTTPAGFLQFTFAEFGFILIGLAAATLVAGWAADETSGRLELLLSTPLGRGRWAILGGAGALLVLALTVFIAAAGIAIGALAAGGDATQPAVGTMALALYGGALVGVGVAIGGVVRASVAGPAVAVLAIATLLADLLAEPLDLPDWVHQLALSAHLGQPMVGTWDPFGATACVLLAVGGLALGSWGIRRRDVSS